MITRKKRRLILIIIIVVILLAIAASFTIVYMKTDMFKSNKTLFMKYLGKNAENLENMYSNIVNKNEFETLMDNNKYTIDTEVTVNNVDNIGTTQESTNNVINNLKIEANGQVDRANKYDYNQLEMYKDDESIAKIEYLQNDNLYGIRFSNLFKQFLLVDNSDLQELLANLGYTENQIQNIPNEINSDSLGISKLKFSDEEKQNLKNKYIELIENNIQDKNFSKQTNQTISIDNKSVQVNAYTLTLTKEQLNNLYLSLLQELKNDEIILGKLDTLQSLINTGYSILNNEENINIKDNFTKKIDETIDQINKNNIGQDATNIIVYENMKSVVRTSIQTNQYIINLDWLNTNQEKYMSISKIIGEDKTDAFAIKTVDNNFEITINNSENEQDIKISQTKKIDGNNMNRNFVALFEDEDSKVQANIIQEIKLTNEFSDQFQLQDGNYIILNDLDKEELNGTMNLVNNNLNDRINNLKTIINFDEIRKVLENANLIKSVQEIESTGTTQTQKDRYNAQYELLKGQNIDKDRVLSNISAIENDINNVEAINDKQWKIGISKNNGNQESSDMIKNIIDKQKSDHYNIDINYDDTTRISR